MRARRITPTSATNSAPAMPITPIGPNMACAIIAAAGGRARAKRRRAWRRARLREKCLDHIYGKVVVRGALVQMGDMHIDAQALGLGRGRAESFLLPRCRMRLLRGRNISKAVRKKGSSFGAVIEVVAEGIPAGLGAPIYGKLDADLAQRHDEHQCGQGRGDRRRLRRRCALRRRKCRRDAQGRQGQTEIPLQSCGRNPGRHFHRPAHRRALRGQADVVDSYRRARPSTSTATKPKSSPKAVTIPASASARCRLAKR